ncbi:MAG: hypothetical protein ABIF92_03280 [archaeon]
MRKPYMKKIIAITFILSIGMLFLSGCITEEIDNEKFCDSDSDCIMHCPKGCINEKFDTPSTALCKLMVGDCNCVDNSCTFIPKDSEQNFNLSDEKCVGEGGEVKTMQIINLFCCEGLHEISSGYRNGVIYCTAEICGDGNCRSVENMFNCPNDCELLQEKLNLNRTLCEEHGGKYDSCGPNGCEKAGGQFCPDVCGEPVCII